MEAHVTAYSQAHRLRERMAQAEVRAELEALQRESTDR